MSARVLHRTMVRAALSAAHVFAWVAAFHVSYFATGSLTEALASVALLYALMHTTTILVVPLAAQNMRHGSRRTLEAAVLCAAAAFAALGGMYLVESVSFSWGMGGFAFLLGIYRALYYIPYELAHERTRRIAFLDVLIALMPAAAGIALAVNSHMPEALFLAAALVLFASLLPMYGIHDRHEGFSWSYRETFHQLFAPENRALLTHSLCEGIEAAALLFVWPIMIWLVVGGSYPLLGVVLSATLLVSMLMRLVLKQFHFAPSPMIASGIQASSWVLRYFAGSAASVLIVDVYAHASEDPRRRGMDLATLEHASDNHTYIDEYTALKEMGQALGRILMCLAIISLALSESFGIVTLGAFALAAMAAVAHIHIARHPARAVI